MGGSGAGKSTLLNTLGKDDLFDDNVVVTATTTTSSSKTLLI